jgi:hypothetical protein
MEKSGCSDLARASRMACKRSEDSAREQTGSSTAVAAHSPNRRDSTSTGDILVDEKELTKKMLLPLEDLSADKHNNHDVVP